MKNIKHIIAFCSIITLLFASCSKDEPVQQMDPANEDSYAILTFNSLLNDLSERAMQKGHFDQIPECIQGTPDNVDITFSVDGGASKTINVGVLGEPGNYFTDYHEDLKILIPNDGNEETDDSVNITLEGFVVYTESGEKLWLAPVRTNSDIDQFEGYVSRSLPFTETVYRGTKPYFNVEVLCFDKRIANEYGYVFFDIVPKTIYPLCLFANYCNEDGKHWVADYAIDLYYGPSISGIQLYSNTQDVAMASTSVVEGEFQADPLCLVVPGPPANMTEAMFDDPYLTLVVYPMDWIAEGSYGDIDNSGVEIQLSWNEVNGLLNADGTTNEYLHLLLGECEDALTGDGTLNPGGGTGNGCTGDIDGDGCDDDDDGDGVIDSNDECPNTPDEVENSEVDSSGCPIDSDNDGIKDYLDDCPNVNPTTDVDGDGCEDVTGGGDPECGTAYYGGVSISTGFKLITATDYTIPLNVIVDASTVTSITSNVTIGTLDLNPRDSDPAIDVAINIENSSEWEVKDYVLTASTSETGSPNIVVEYDETQGDPGASFNIVLPLGDLEGYDGSTLYLKAEFDVCEKE